MDATELPFRNIWLVHFEAGSPPGEPLRPLCLAAVELRKRTKVTLMADDLAAVGRPPMDTDLSSVYVAFDANLAMRCHLALGWGLPIHIIDLFAELRAATNGLWHPKERFIAEGLAYFGLPYRDLATDMAKLRHLRDRHSALPLFADLARRVCSGTVDGLEALFNLLISDSQLHAALRRGAYARAAATIEMRGIPIDLRIAGLIRQSLAEGVAFWHAEEAVPAIKGLRKLTIGRDGRNRAALGTFGAKTGRNAPSSTQWIFGHPAGVRGVIRPDAGSALGYLDWRFQEFGIGAALSGDGVMMDAYRSGDPYLAFARQTRAVPSHATKESHADARRLHKQAVLAIQYGAAAEALSDRLGQSVANARALIDCHRLAFASYWRWSEGVEHQAALYGVLESVGGWPLRFHQMSPSALRSAKNFPIQAAGAELLRLAACLITEQGIGVCTLVHDAILIEAPLAEIDDAVAMARQQMGDASERVLSGFRLETEVAVFRYPERFVDPRGHAIWERFEQHLEEVQRG